jgi:hypothetical protein
MVGSHWPQVSQVPTAQHTCALRKKTRKLYITRVFQQLTSPDFATAGSGARTAGSPRCCLLLPPLHLRLTMSEKLISDAMISDLETKRVTIRILVTRVNGTRH